MTHREATIIRVIDAPRELVWKTWMEPEQVARWWGPQHAERRVTRAFTAAIAVSRALSGGARRSGAGRADLPPGT
jgi:uncharacterized protein YndB with AHSA1/START domain